MPTYTYKCYECDKIQEESHGMNDTPSIKCNICGSLTKKIITASTIQLPVEFNINCIDD